MSNKNNVNGLFSGSEINLDDFYLADNDSGKTKKNETFSGDSEQKKHDFFSSIKNTETKINDNVTKTNDNSALGNESFNFAFKNTYSTKKEPEVSVTSQSLNDDDIINEILNTDIVENTKKSNLITSYQNVEKQVGNHEAVLSQNDKFVSPALNQDYDLKNDQNLNKLNALKEKLQNASDSFSRITDSIELLSNDINDANKGYVDYFRTEDLVTKTSDMNIPTVEYSIQSVPKLKRQKNEFKVFSSTPQETAADSTVLFDKNVIGEHDAMVEASKTVTSHDLSDNFVEEFTSKHKKYHENNANTNMQLSTTDLMYLGQDNQKDNPLDPSITNLENNKNVNYTFDSNKTTNKNTQQDLNENLVAKQEQNNSEINEPVSKEINPSFDYDKVMEELTKRAFERAQGAIRSQVDELNREKMKFQAEVEEFNRNRSIQSDIEQLNSRFSSAIGHYITSGFSNIDEDDFPTENSSKQPEVDIQSIEQERQNIVNSTKDIIEQLEKKPSTNFIHEHVDEINGLSESTPKKIANQNDEELEEMVGKVDQMKKEISNLKSLLYKEKINKATEKLKTKILSGTIEEEKKFDQLIEKTITDEINQQVNTNTSFLDDHHPTDSLGDMRNSLRNRKVGNEVEEQNRLFEIEKMRTEIKNEILDELRMTNFVNSKNLSDEWELDNSLAQEVEKVIGHNIEINTDFAKNPQSIFITEPTLMLDQNTSQLNEQELSSQYPEDISDKKTDKLSK